MEPVKPEILQIMCRCCGKIFYMCRACYRGHVYCSTKCRIAGYLQKHREAQKRYRGKEKGRLKHRELEKERRNKFKGKGNKITEKIVNCMSSVIQSMFESIFKVKKIGEDKTEKCQNCGKLGIVVTEFKER
ncbi:hypothetical protein MHK_006186 [Candidatus Magnetomorum sp. HK-1]|nr:hypothetical protein MHK_008989 [Candidatus Magnetomorum sp. HK-1]KPA13609.1 hypothetical protein MHK_006186 [Candidatus Magnetomorum sp. HK-1]